MEASAIDGGKEGDAFSAVVRFVGGDQAEPIPGLQVTATNYEEGAKKYGPFTTDEEGKTKVSLPTTGSYRLTLGATKETPWLPVDKKWIGKRLGGRNSLYLKVTKDDLEKGPGEEKGPLATSKNGERLVSFHLIRACKVVLRAIDAETGAGISGAEFYTQSLLGEDWAHEIWGDNVGFQKPSIAKDRRTNSAGEFIRLLGTDAGYDYGVDRNPPGYTAIDPNEETKLNLRYGQAKVVHVFKFKRDPDSILWSKKNRNGLVAGAKLLSATGKLDPGDPIVVQFVLKNDSDKEQTFILRASDSHPTLGADNRLELNVNGSSQNTFQHTLKPGEILEKRQYRVTVDTTGMPPGKYHITSGSAFWQTKKDKPNSATGIPFRREIPFTLGDPKLVKQKQPPVDENLETKIYWGKPSGNLILGMRLPKGRETWPEDQIDIQGQLFLFNAGDDEIELTYELPSNPADWNMHVTSRDNDKFVRLDSTWDTGIEPQRTRTITVPQWGRVAITGIRAEVTTDGKTVEEMTKGIKRTAVEMIKGPTLRILKEETKFKYGDPKRLINQQGRFNFHAALTIHQSGLTDATIVASSAPVPFEIKTDGDKESPEASPAKPESPQPAEGKPSPPSSTPGKSDQSSVEPSTSPRVVAATVLGKPMFLDQFDKTASEIIRVTKSDRSLLSHKAELILAKVAGQIMMDYYQREKLHPTKDEISAKFAAALRTHPDLLGKMMLNKQSRFELGGSMAFGVASSVDWVVTKHLHEKYGGSVASQ